MRGARSKETEDKAGNADIPVNEENDELGYARRGGARPPRTPEAPS